MENKMYCGDKEILPIGYGNFGPKTRAKFNELSSGTKPASSSVPDINSLLSQLQALQDLLKKLKGN